MATDATLLKWLGTLSIFPQNRGSVFHPGQGSSRIKVFVLPLPFTQQHIQLSFIHTIIIDGIILPDNGSKSSIFIKSDDLLLTGSYKSPDYQKYRPPKIAPFAPYLIIWQRPAALKISICLDIPFSTFPIGHSEISVRQYFKIFKHFPTKKGNKGDGSIFQRF